MDITYLGHSSFRIKGKTTTLVTDPYASEEVGLKFPKHVAADIVTVSHDHADHNVVDQIEGPPYVLHGPGEYEIKGVGVIGISTYHDEEKGEKRGKNTIYRMEMDGINIVHLGDLGHTLSADIVDELDGVDILMVPVGGIYTVDPAKAVEIINELEPSIVLPMHYGRPELVAKTYGELSTLAAFLKEIGKQEVVAQPKLSITKDKLPEQMQVVVLE
jgi:L-ascorbate metabolism protein UlaG (beta-lactamase superfamily)